MPRVIRVKRENVSERHSQRLNQARNTEQYLMTRRVQPKKGNIRKLMTENGRHTNPLV